MLYFILSLIHGYMNPGYETYKILTYFIPDLLLCLMNMIVTFYFYPNLKETNKYLSSPKMLIVNAGFYINILTTIYYIILYWYMTERGITGEDCTPEESFLCTNWRQTPEIWKYKLPANCNALFFKLYADYIKYRAIQSIDSQK
ncbi:UNKNOWN [Stylonychia lemnae]|uniref:Uncharacterized protein n=1 Tax=Stylonychia lemnae TaxID=5949 RepID=A0A078B090_STYLE|nr:UNKNOWN [Stylonychia lemnae]|eukprot:CDW87909.1 UNKNOWN [Stylonychia lemnae]